MPEHLPEVTVSYLPGIGETVTVGFEDITGRALRLGDKVHARDLTTHAVLTVSGIGHAAATVDLVRPRPSARL
ncbi:hypothetical protein IU487_22320 [Nocardia puris]|uniref:hypothetical protein n=1 Tax=Nocardia puris TaxID=208602 RepID=UPI0018958CC7|nr:hypothetical protein [Nocardia puris]MBF6213756.1 hypothetical protein [Nocardia puris]